MVLLTATPAILTHLSGLPSNVLSELELTDGGTDETVSTDVATTKNTTSRHCRPTQPGQPISHTALTALVRLLRSQGQDVTLNALLRGTKPYQHPPPPRPEQTPEYKALMARLRAEQERKDYVKLTTSSSASHDPSQGQESFDAVEYSDADSDNISPSLVLNIFLSILLCAAAVFVMTRYWSNDGVRVLVSLFTGIVVGIAEVVVYAAYLRKVKEAKGKERRKKERKLLIGEYTGPTRAQIDATGTKIGTDGDSEEIWGRGKHGGLRRRVREKWAKEKDRVSPAVS